MRGLRVVAVASRSVGCGRDFGAKRASWRHVATGWGHWPVVACAAGESHLRLPSSSGPTVGLTGCASPDPRQCRKLLRAPLVVCRRDAGQKTVADLDLLRCWNGRVGLNWPFLTSTRARLTEVRASIGRSSHHAVTELREFMLLRRELVASRTVRAMFPMPRSRAPGPPVHKGPRNDARVFVRGAALD